MQRCLAQVAARVLAGRCARCCAAGWTRCAISRPLLVDDGVQLLETMDGRWSRRLRACWPHACDEGWPIVVRRCGVLVARKRAGRATLRATSCAAVQVFFSCGGRRPAAAPAMS
ncbi:hypothetical protein F511_45753 [Dorcoceras hygrometricum]|uniref:Uncharacterized protein n=1 Tax=Dorcoceras hygrometricum TaxID=472368 RepID=A0A2Z6ZV67_9LAMI|nr:hypothetical protein F511_45753 [Dorcoceras hygrometricum]